MLRRCLWACLCVLWCGCASTPADRNWTVLQTALTEAELPAELHGFRAQEGLLTRKVLRFRYVREEPPAMLWLLRFAESPTEQYPHDVRSFDSSLEEVRAATEGFDLSERIRLLSKANTPIQGAHYSFREEGEERAGFLCQWADRQEPGAAVFILRVVAPETVTVGEVQGILRAVGAL